MSQRQIHILLVEDDAGDARRFRDMLESAAFKFELTHADRLSAALSCLQRCNVDVVLLDLSLSDSHGLQTVTRVLELAPQVPVVVLTGTNDEQLAISTVQRGAQDYLIKGEPSVDSVIRCIRYAIDRKRIERALLKSESQFRTVFDQAGIGMVVVDLSGRVVRCNTALREMLAYSEQELCGKEFARLTHEDDLETSLGAFRGLVAGECDRIRLEQRYRRGDGEVVWGWLTASLVHGGDGEPDFAIVMIEDITDRKRAEEALRESEEFNCQIIESSDDCNKVLDLEGRLSFMSEAGQRLLEIEDIDAYLGRSWVDFFQGADRKAAADAIARACQGDVGRFRGFSPTTTGRPKWWDVVITPIVGPAGCVERLLAVSRDVTERKGIEDALLRSESELRKHKERLEEMVGKRTAELAEANEQLRESEGRFRRIFEHSGDAIFVIDPESDEILDANDSACRMLDYSPEDLLSAPLSAVYSDEIEAFRALRFPMFAEGGQWSGQLTCRTRTGKRLVTEVSATLLDIGSKRCILAVVRDVTQRQRAQEELEKAKEQAEAGDRAKSEFVASMSHELRTPLNGVIGMTELLLGTDLDKQQRRYAWLIKSSGDTLLSLISDILDFSKIEAGKLELETIDFDLQYAVESVAVALASKAEAKGLELVAGVHPQVPPLLRGDPGRLQQILLNLTNNAVKFADEGEVVVRAALDHETDVRATVRFTVNDTGIGIPRDRLDRVFKSFSQVDASTTRQYGGTGLGLAICKQLVGLMGGRIGVESEPGKGSTFWFTVEFEKQTAARRQPRPILEDLRRVPILAVDDNETNREILHEQLTGWGLEHETAADGKAALRILREAAAVGSPFGLAIVDMQMPGMDGEQLAAAIKADPSIEDTVLVLLTSIQDMDASRLNEVGFAGCLTKPVRQTQLLDAIAEAYVCARASGRRVRREMEGRVEATRRVSRAATMAGACILVAEDDAISQEVAVSLLIRAGYRYETAANGQEAVEAVRRTGFDLILMDCQMPEMDGFLATRAIRQAEKDGALSNRKKGRIPIIALTANAIKGDRERCLAAGMDDYISKPLEAERLLEVISTHLRAAGGDLPDDANHPLSRTEAAVRHEARVSASPPPIDGDALLKRWSGHEDVVQRILTKFEAQAGADLERIEQSVALADAGQTERLAHGLKGAAGYVAAGRVYELAAELEAMGCAGDLSDAEACLGQVREELNRCLEHIPQLLAKVGRT